MGIRANLVEAYTQAIVDYDQARRRMKALGKKLTDEEERSAEYEAYCRKKAERLNVPVEQVRAGEEPW